MSRTPTGRTRPFADAERRRLEGVRATHWRRSWRPELALGRTPRSVPELERLVAEDPLQRGVVGLLVLALYRAAGRATRWPRSGGPGRCWPRSSVSNPGPGLRAAGAGDPGPGPGARPAAPTPARARARAAAPGDRRLAGCPYKGLAAYEVGRRRGVPRPRTAVAPLVAALVDHRLLVVSGSSGAGKSSVVRAGLVPALAAGALPGSAAWRPVVVTPGRRPVDALAGADRRGADRRTPVRAGLRPVRGAVVAGRRAAERTAFLDTVLGLLDDGVVVRCVLVVRGDHVGRLAEHPAFAERLGRRAGAGAAADRGRAAAGRRGAGPRRRARGRAGADRRRRADVLGRAGALPLLSTALVGTWERRREGPAHPGRLPGRRRGRRCGGPLGRGRVRRAATSEASEAGPAGAGPAGRAGRQRGAACAGRCRSTELDLDGADPAGDAAVVETLVAASPARRATATGSRSPTRRCSPRGRGWRRGWRTTPSAGGAAAPRPGRGRVGPGRAAGRRAVPRCSAGAAAEWAGDPDAGLTEVEREFLDGRRRARRRRAPGRPRRAAAEAAGTAPHPPARGRAGRGRWCSPWSRPWSPSASSATATERAADARGAAPWPTPTGWPHCPTTARPGPVPAAGGPRGAAADTPETQDGLLAALVEHRRATGCIPFPAGLRRSMSAWTGGTPTCHSPAPAPKWCPGGSGRPQHRRCSTGVVAGLHRRLSRRPDVVPRGIIEATCPLSRSAPGTAAP